MGRARAHRRTCPKSDQHDGPGGAQPWMTRARTATPPSQPEHQRQSQKHSLWARAGARQSAAARCASGHRPGGARALPSWRGAQCHMGAAVHAHTFLRRSRATPATPRRSGSLPEHLRKRLLSNTLFKWTKAPLSPGPRQHRALPSLAPNVPQDTDACPLLVRGPSEKTAQDETVDAGRRARPTTNMCQHWGQSDAARPGGGKHGAGGNSAASSPAIARTASGTRNSRGRPRPRAPSGIGLCFLTPICLGQTGVGTRQRLRCKSVAPTRSQPSCPESAKAGRESTNSGPSWVRGRPRSRQRQ